MKLLFINKRAARTPKAFLKKWVNSAAARLKISKSKELTLVFVGRKESEDLNFRFRRKKRPTDVLSFDPLEDHSLGELVLCQPLIVKQAKDHGLTYEEELGYLVLHGMLHLLGFEHETSKASAKKMFRLQDLLFEDLCDRLLDGTKRNIRKSLHGYRDRIVRNPKPNRKAAHSR
jgi:probable rRNA maturation factor